MTPASAAEDGSPRPLCKKKKTVNQNKVVKKVKSVKQREAQR